MIKRLPAVEANFDRVAHQAALADRLGGGTISIRLWESVGRANWRPFDEARAFVGAIGLKNAHEWWDYVRSGKKPPDIPANPSATYAKVGWDNWGDWLGTGTVSQRLRQYRSFTRARAFARGLGLKSAPEWVSYCGSGKKPTDIPASPDHVYLNDGWVGMGDWLGTGRRRRRGWQPFKKARAFVRGLDLKSGTEWREYCKKGRKPPDIPSNPNEAYAKTGWVGMGDWLGTGTVSNRSRQYRSFTKARVFVRRLGLKSYSQWRDYCRKGKKPNDIPTHPDRVYAEAGWAGYPDWFGHSRPAAVR